MPIKMIKILFILLFSTLLNASVDDYSLNIKLDKKMVYFGDGVHLKLTFKYKDLQDYELPEIKLKNFEVKELNSSDYKQKSGMYIEEVNYELTPQKNGKFKIGGFKTKIETVGKNYKGFNNISKYIKKFSVTSNTLYLNVKSLQKNISIIGNYSLSAKVDKQRVKTGEIVTFTIALQGVGNIKNLDSIKLKIPNATVYLVMSSKSARQELFTKTFEIIADNSYVIPSFTLEYFNEELGIVKTTQSQSFQINVINFQSIKKSINYSLTYKKQLIVFLSGMFSMLCLVILYLLYKKYKLKNIESSFIKSLKQTKNQNNLYKKIVVYLGQNKELDELIYILESKKYIKFKKIKQEIIKTVKII